MNSRKVQQLGKSTLALTLPALWARENDVEKGDSLSIHSRGPGTLTLIADSANPAERKVTIHAQELDKQALERAIIGQYVLGRQIITIHSESCLTDDHISAIYAAERQLMGLGVIEETPTEISIRCSVDSGDFTINNLIERLENTGSTMRNEAIKALLRGNPDLAQRAIRRERQANKIFVLLLRLIFTSHQNPVQVKALGIEKELELIGYRSIAKNLELAADNAEDIATLVLSVSGDIRPLDQSVSRDLLEFSSLVDGLSSLAIDAIVARDYDLYLECRTQFHAINNAEDSLLSELPELDPEELMRIRQAIISLHQTAEAAIRNAEIAANLILNQDSKYITIH